VVIGAGLSGLAVALDLAETGREVVILEAQSRPGGRILTLRAPFGSRTLEESGPERERGSRTLEESGPEREHGSRTLEESGPERERGSRTLEESGPERESLFVEAGATHVVADPDLLARMASVGVRVVKPKPPRGLSTIAYFDGKRARFGPGEEPPDRFALSPEERKLDFLGRLDKYFASIKGTDPTAAWPPLSLASHDAQTGAALLEELGASPGYAESFASAFLGERASAMSAAFVLREMANFYRDAALGGSGRVEGGSDRLPFALAQRLGPRVLYGAEAKRIEQDERGARVAFLKGGALHWLAAERVVCAIPYSVLRDLEVSPAFSTLKSHAIRELVHVSVARIFAQFDRRFWTERGDAGDAETDLPTGSVRDETKFERGTAGVLGAYLSSEGARRIAALPEADRLSAFIDDADRVHPGARERFVGGVTKCWDEDPFARGAYAWFKPGQMTEFGTALASPEGRVHFAGDHTSHRPGFMHGAVASAKRVVREILASTFASVPSPRSGVPTSAPDARTTVSGGGAS
jgi:monoamine oxidase